MFLSEAAEVTLQDSHWRKRIGGEGRQTVSRPRWW